MQYRDPIVQYSTYSMSDNGSLSMGVLLRRHLLGGYRANNNLTRVAYLSTSADTIDLQAGSTKKWGASARG